MMAAVIGLCLALGVHEAYAERDTAALRTHLEGAGGRADALLARYRLYFLSQDRALIARLPGSLDDGAPRELALLSALWAARVPGAPPWQQVRYGRRSVGLLDRALRGDSADPLIRLIAAQSLLFRPGIVGGDARRAVADLRRLADDLRRGPACGTSLAEVETWLWFALRRTGDPAAEALRGRLLAENLAPLYRAFLDAPP